MLTPFRQGTALLDATEQHAVTARAQQQPTVEAVEGERRGDGGEAAGADEPDGVEVSHEIMVHKELHPLIRMHLWRGQLGGNG